MKKICLYVCICLSLVIFVNASIWEGAAASSTRGELPEAGLFIATNAFPVNSVVEVTNLDNGKTVRALTTTHLDAPGLLAILSREAATEIELPSRSLGRVRMVQGEEPAVVSNMGNEFSSSADPDYNPALFVAMNGFAPHFDDGLTDESTMWGNHRVESGDLIVDLSEYTEIIPEEYVPVEYPAPVIVAVHDEPIIDYPVIEDPEPVVIENDYDLALIPAEERPPEDTTEIDESLFIPAIVHEEVPEEIAEEPPVLIAEEIPEEVFEEEYELIAEEIPEEIFEEEYELIAEEIPEEVFEEEYELIAEEIPEEIPVEIPEDIDPMYLVEAVEEEEEPELPPELPVAVLPVLPPEPAPALPPPAPQPVPPALPQAAPVLQPPAPLIPVLPQEQPRVTTVYTPPSVQPFSVPLISSLERGQYYLQIAAFSKAETVESELSKIDYRLPRAVMNAGTAESPVYRILIGPVNLGESGALLQRFKTDYKDAFIRHGS